jgi:hypothetical protein
VVQRRASGAEGEQVHDAAARGIAGPATSLPFADQIQASFGTRHDVSSIQAHVGGPATEATTAMGASAYATGNHAVFAGAPDLHTAAHEAAHVVQQAHGVNLYGGVGQAGDSYERHADAVADRVVAGQSSADLLDGITSGGHGPAAATVQRKGMTVEEAAKRIESLMSYGVFDWAITDGDSLEVVQILQGLSAADRRAALVKVGPKYIKRLAENLPADKANLLAGLVPGEEKKPGDKPLEEQIKTTANPERAQTALTELRARQAAETRAPKRLTDGIIELMVWGVGRAMHKDATDKGKEGILGIEHASNAADALIKMPVEAYLQIIATLVMTGGDAAADQKVESLLILKAVGARKDEFQKGDAKAQGDVDAFATKIRGRDAEKLKDDTTTRDHTSGGLQQKFTMTCGPTSIQVTHGEADPIFAMQVTESAKQNLDYKSTVGTEQKDYLGATAIPRLVMDDWSKFNTWLGGLPAADQAKGLALSNWIAGKTFNATTKAQGVTLAIAAGYPQDRLDEFKKYYPFPEPGWQNSDFATKANAVLGGPTGGARFDERPIPPQYQNIAGKMTPISTMKQADVDKLYAALFRGKDVPMGIMWSGGGGHFMVFTDCRETVTGTTKVREYLLHDPWAGTSAWITEANVLAGNLNPYGTGAIDSLYL